MESIKCDKCDKVIEGYSEKHVNYLMDQHKLSKHKASFKQNDTRA